MYKREEETVFSSSSSSLQPYEESKKKKRKRKLERKRKIVTEFLKLERRKTFISFLLFTVQISSNGRSCFVCGPIDLKFEGEIFNSLISNLNGEDQIWSSGRLLLQSVNVFVVEFLLTRAVLIFSFDRD